MSKPRRHFRFDTPAAATSALLDVLAPVSTELVAWHEAPGRILGSEIVSDRESPPCDASAMDGYAVRLADLSPAEIPVAGEVRIGRPIPAMPPGSALKIVTGAPVPAEADAVVPREMTQEQAGRFTLTVDPASIKRGQNIRRRGENLSSGAEVVPIGRIVTPAVMSAAVTFGVARPAVYRKVRVAILVTGDELLTVNDSPKPWQIRNCNGPVLQSLVSLSPWLELKACLQIPDDEAAIERQFTQMLRDCDAILLTGGVSMGDYDFVPGIVERAGCRVVFHGVPIRPGQPLLAAAGPEGQLVMGLPGNPVSVMSCACRFARPALARLAGLRELAAPIPVLMDASDAKSIDLWWYRPVTLTPAGKALPVASKGSGDMVSAARSDGFIELPPSSAGAGPWPFYRWEI